jgi:hypothetical protein
MATSHTQITGPAHSINQVVPRCENAGVEVGQELGRQEICRVRADEDHSKMGAKLPRLHGEVATIEAGHLEVRHQRHYGGELPQQHHPVFRGGRGGDRQPPALSRLTEQLEHRQVIVDEDHPVAAGSVGSFETTLRRPKMAANLSRTRKVTE